MAYIELSGKRGKGQRTLVDDSTLKQYGHLSWYLGDTGYVMRKPQGQILRLHRLVLEAKEGEVVDHLNGNKLDNRLNNLRICTHKENTQNRKGTKGYCWDSTRGKWLVTYRAKFYGRYTTEQEAKKAYQLACSGVPYKKTRRKQYMLPRGIHKQFGKYNVSLQRDTIRKRKNGITTLDEALRILNQWKEEG